jgi:Rps23 Pro-64 3,4-dihydroxylase Tpa1-like proline 4-hydroxylase
MPTSSSSPGELDPDPRLAADLDVALVATVLRRAKRVHVPGALAPDVATRLHRELVESTDWSISTNEGDRNFTVPVAAFGSMDPAARLGFERRVHANAARGFQYLYKNYPIHDEFVAGRLSGYLARFYAFLNSPAFLDFARAVTGRAGVTRVDAQATLYEPGHFLTQHDDRDDTKRRVAAYVLNLTPRWHADWGGVLQFLDADGHVAEGYVPRFNALNLFLVPQPHSVGCVAPFAPAGRYAITGWIRED